MSVNVELCNPAGPRFSALFGIIDARGTFSRGVISGAEITMEILMHH
jgi:hypothetical protein